MENLFKVLLWTLFTMSMTGCNEDQQTILVDQFDVQLVILDEDGNEQTVFKNGEDVSMMVKLINLSSEEIEAGSYYDYCEIYTIEEFLLIYKWMKKSDNEEESWVPLGKAYVTPVNCPTVNIPVVVPAQGEKLVVGSKWSDNPANAQLTPGKYYTAFNYSLELDGQSKIVALKAEFEVQ